MIVLKIIVILIACCVSYICGKAVMKEEVERLKDEIVLLRIYIDKLKNKENEDV
jgi:hypothetical protein